MSLKLKSIALMITCFALLSGIPPDNDEVRMHPFSPVTLDAADSVMVRLDDNGRIAQLFIVRNGSKNQPYAGGYLFDHLDSAESMGSVDPNGIPYFKGYNMLKDNSGFASEQQLAESNNPSLVSRYTHTVGNLLRSNGFNFILGPSLSLTSIDQDAAESRHSFSDDPTTTMTYAIAAVHGFRSAGISPVVGNYHQLTNDESNIHSENSPIKNELKPYKGLVNEGIQNIMTSNVLIPALDSGTSFLASESQLANDVLKTKLGFNGLVWADLSQHHSDTVPNPTRGFIAVNDVTIIDENLADYIEYVNQAIELGLLSREDINKKCKRVIQAKIWSVRNQPKKKDSSTISIELELANRALIESSLTLLRNQHNRIPLRGLDSLHIAYIRIADDPTDLTAELVQRYSAADIYSIRFDHLEEDFASFERIQNDYNLVIMLASPQENLARKRYGISENYQSIIERIAYKQSTIFSWYGNTKALLFVSNIPTLESVITGHESNVLTLDFTIQKIFGGRPFSGRLKRKVGDTFEREFGIDTEKTRLAYGIPEEVGIKSEYLHPIDGIVANAIKEKACPGAQVWFAKDGMVVVNEAFGHHTYESKDTVNKDDLYDLASITKIAGSMAGLMKLNQDSLFNLDHSLCDYLSEWVDTTAYMNMGMRDIFAHQAGLPAFIPFYASTLQKGVPRYDIYSIAQNETYSLRVARELYIRADQSDRMFRQIINHPIKAEKQYKYSDVGYYFALRIIEKQSGMPMDDYLNTKIYKPLGLTTMGYRPLERFDKARITPTEYDRYFRKQLVHGDVHDPGAAMLGGVGGHAGLFSNANDLGILMQMYLNGGDYGSVHYFDSTIIQDFVRCQFCDNNNRRGAGFDKPLTNGGSGPSCGCTSRDAFGHQGFTGTVTWVDPDQKVVYVFLSNRVYPNADNKKLAHMNVRTDIQQVFYDAIEKSQPDDSTASQF